MALIRQETQVRLIVLAVIMAAVVSIINLLGGCASSADYPYEGSLLDNHGQRVTRPEWRQ